MVCIKISSVYLLWIGRSLSSDTFGTTGFSNQGRPRSAVQQIDTNPLGDKYHKVRLSSHEHHQHHHESTAHAARALTWDERFSELLEYKRKFNHTCVSKRLPEHRELGIWVSRQRQRYKKLVIQLEAQGVLDVDIETPMLSTTTSTMSTRDISRISRLISIGFDWEASYMKREKERQQWWKRLEEVRRVCNSESLNEAVPPLAEAVLSASQQDWLRRQQKQYQTLDPDQIQALNEMDDTWWMNSRQRLFEVRFRELKMYKVSTGDCNVPISYPNRKLANWYV